MGIDIDDPDPGDRTGDVTLVFSLGAARRLSTQRQRSRTRGSGAATSGSSPTTQTQSSDSSARRVSRTTTRPELGQVGTLGDIHEESGAPGRCSSARRLRTVASRPTSASSTCRSTRRPRRRDGRSRSPNGRANRGDQSPVAGAESAARLIDGGDTARERSRTAIDERERRLAIAPTRRLLDRSRSTRPCSSSVKTVRSGEQRLAATVGRASDDSSISRSIRSPAVITGSSGGVGL